MIPDPPCARSAGRTTVRIAAVGDLHVGADSHPAEFGLDTVDRDADLLLLAGDLTRRGSVAEVEVLCSVLERVRVPVVAVLGNHDHESGRVRHVEAALSGLGVRVLEGTACLENVKGVRVGVAGTKGFGGGTAGLSATAFGEPEMKAFVGHGEVLAARLGDALGGLCSDLRIVLLHYAPIADTLVGEAAQIHPFLADYRLARAVDRHGADLVLHGHAHAGRERGHTPGGVPVRNVARPVIRGPYRVFRLEGHRA